MDRSETPRASQQQQQRSSPRQPTESSSRKAKNRSRSGSEELSQIVAQAQANARSSRYGNGFASLDHYQPDVGFLRPESATPTPFSVRNARADGEGGEQQQQQQQQRVTSPGLLGWVRNALMLGPSGRTLSTTADSQVQQSGSGSSANGSVRPSAVTTSDPVKRNQTPLLPGILPSFHNVNRYGSRGDEETRSMTLSERSASWSSIGKESIEAYDRRNRRASSMSTDSSASVYDVGSNDGMDEEDNSDAEDVYAPYAQRQHGPSLVRPTARREALGFGPVDELINGPSSLTRTATQDTTANNDSATRSDDHALSISEAQDSSQYIVDQSDRSALPDLVSSPDPSNKSRQVSQSPLAGWVDAPTPNRTPKPMLEHSMGSSVQQKPQTPSQQSFVTQSSVDNHVDFMTADEVMTRRKSAMLLENRSSSESVDGGTSSAYVGDGEDLNDRSGRPKSPEELIRNRRSRESVVLGSRGASARAGGGTSERPSRRTARESSGPVVRGDRIEETEESEAPPIARKTSLDEAGRVVDAQQSAKRPTTPAGSTSATTTSVSGGGKRGLFGRRRLGNASEPGRKSSAADAWDESDSTAASGEAKVTSPDAKSFWRSAKRGTGSKQQPASVVTATDADAPSSSNAKTSSECPSTVCPTDSWAKRKQPRGGALDAAMHPRKVKVRSRNKSSKERDFARLYLAQEIFLGSSDRPSGAPVTPTASPKLDDDAESFGNQNVRSDASEQNFESKGVAEAANTTNKRRATWAMRFSLDGQHLAVAGQDAVIRVYAVLATPEARQRALFETIEAAGRTPISAHNRSATDSTAVNVSAEDAESSTSKASAAELPHLLVFSQKPVREFRGHTNDILDLSWSKGGFLLSAGMDCTARVWHMSKPSSLVAFKHGDFVTCVVFHPRDDRFFLSGSLDGKLRLWNISTKRVQASQEIPGLITACAFTHSGKTACVGTFSGAALFYHTEDLVFVSSVAVRSATGKYQKGGRKITAIEPILPDPMAEGLSAAKHVNDDDGGKHERERVLITSNDSRVRAYDLSNNTIVARFKAKSYNNRSSQIKATLSDDNVYVVAGSEATSNSEGGQVHVWECSSILFERSTHSLLAKLTSSSMNAVNSANQRTTGLLRSAKAGVASDKNEKELEKVMQKSKNRSAVTSDSVVEYFTAHAGTVTCAIMAPLRTNSLLRQANDPILVRSEERLNSSRLAGSVNLVEMLAGVPINIGRGLAYAIQTPLRMGANAVTQATRNASTPVISTTKDSDSPSSVAAAAAAAATAAETNEMVILNRKLNRIILTVDDNATVRVWRSDSLQTISY